MSIFGLIDGNAFYCSCETAFDPKIRNVPLVVLSNNDGCAIARSSIARTLGVKMGDPWHLIKDRPELKNVKWYSSNYTLYGDMSRRVYQVLCERIPLVEPYSIDETFLDLTNLPTNVYNTCKQLRHDVRKIAKIPTCVGWGPTKTIAKLGNTIAKNNAELEGLCDLTDITVRQQWYEKISVDKIWGIGPANSDKLNKNGIFTISDFMNLSTKRVRSMLTVSGLRTQAELNGISCIPLSLSPPPRKGLAVTRAFGRPVTTWQDMREAVVTYATKAAEKLRAEDMLVGHVSVFIRTNPHNLIGGWYSHEKGAKIEPTSNTMAIIEESVKLLEDIWQPNYKYFKAGVVFSDLTPQDQQPKMLFSTRSKRSTKIMSALDSINAKYGKNAITPLSSGINQSWITRHNHLSKRFTTRIDEVLEAKAW